MIFGSGDDYLLQYGAIWRTGANAATQISFSDVVKVGGQEVPAGAVVVPGNLPSDDGKYSLYCAVIVKRVDEKTRSKVGINELLRDI